MRPTQSAQPTGVGAEDSNSSTNVDQDSMYFDTDDFDFLSLTDVHEEDNSNSLGYKQPKGRESVEDFESDEPLFESEEEEPVFESEEEESEEEDESEEGEEDGEVTVEDEDGEEVDFEDYRVTLPDGEEIVLSEVIKGYRDGQALDAAIAEFQETQEQFKAESSQLNAYLELAKLEAERVIEDYEDFDWGAFRREDPAGYVDNREYLDKFIKRRKEIVEAMDSIRAKEEAAKADEFAGKAAEAGAILARDIPGWSKELYTSMMEYAIENGSEKEAIEQCVDPAVFKIIYKAMQFDKGKQVVKAKIKKIGGSPTKVASPNAKPAKPVETGKRTAYLKKMQSGGLSANEVSDMFNHLVD